MKTIDPSTSKKKAPKWLQILVICLISLGIISFFFDSDSDVVSAKSTTATTTETVIKKSPERLLAILDEGSDLKENDIKVNAIRNYLDKLSNRYHESKDTIAEYTSRTQGVLYDHGIKEKCVDILHNIFLEYANNDQLNLKFKDVTILYLMDKTNR